MLTDDVWHESTWTVMFAEDIMICSESGEQQRACRGGGLHVRRSQQGGGKQGDRFTDAEKEDMQKVGVTDEGLKQIIGCEEP